MPVTETGYLCIADRVAEFGLHVRAQRLRDPADNIAVAIWRGSDRMCRKLTCEDDISGFASLAVKATRIADM